MPAMKTFLVRLVINALAIWLAAAVVHGVDLTTQGTANKFFTLLLVALIFGFVNALIKPIVKLFSIPLYILTLGLITFLINALMLWLTGLISHALGLAFSVHGFWSAIVGALIISVVSWVLSALLPDSN